MQGFTNESDIVYEPFMGSGTTLISCIQNNRYSIGIEINQEYCRIAKNRILYNQPLLL